MGTGLERSIYHPTHSDIQDLARIQYFVTDGNGTGQPGVWWRPGNPRYDAIVRACFEVISYQPAETLTHRRRRLRPSKAPYPIGPPYVFVMDLSVAARVA